MSKTRCLVGFWYDTAMFKNKPFLILVLLTLALTACGNGVDREKIIGTWFYSISECDGDETTLQGATSEITFENSGDGTRTFVHGNCEYTSEFKWVLDGSTIVIAPTETKCDPTNCSIDMEIGGIEFALDCSENFEDIWQSSEVKVDGGIATEIFGIQSQSCKNTYINPDL